MTGDERLRWRVSWWTVLAFVPLLPLFRWWTNRRSAQVSALQAVREIHLTFMLDLFLLGSVLPHVVEPQPNPSILPTVFLGFLTAGAIAGGYHFSRRTWPSDAPPEVLATIYRTRYFLEAAFAMSVAMYGYVDVFISGWLWPYLVGGTIAFIWLWLVGPTSTNVLRLERQLRQVSPGASLVEGLVALPYGA